MRKIFAVICLWGLLLTEAICSDNIAVVAFAHRNAEKFKNEIVETKGVAVGSTVTLQGHLNRIDLIGTRYEPESGEMVIDPTYFSLAIKTNLMFFESCKSNGSFIGQNAFGAKTVVRREKCERYFANGDGDVMGVTIGGVRIKMSPSQFRAIKKSGVLTELDLAIGHTKRDVVVDYQETVNDATIDSPIESDLKIWTVYGRIEEIRWSLPSEKSTKGAASVLYRSAQRASLQGEVDPDQDNEALDSRLDANGNNGLHLAIWKGFTKRALRIVETKKVDLNDRNKYGATALHLAVAKENVKIVQVLINAGASSEILDNDGASPLMDARKLGNREIINILEQAHAK